MIEVAKKLKKEVSGLSCAKNIKCFLLYGSILNKESVNDFDAVVIVEKIDKNIRELFRLLATKHKKLDINLYTQDEVENNLSYFTREFKLEYLADGLCIIGINIFKEKFSEVTRFEYEQSMLIRSIERLQIVRQNFFLNTLSSQDKRAYIEKYFLRISRNILILQGIGDNAFVNNLKKEDVERNMRVLGTPSLPPNIFSREMDIDVFYEIFDSTISWGLMKCKRDFDSKYKQI
ncbi:MAG: hypothetical protein LiPW41_41 [Parcubacteria group bacterium LiPW_41]|nr:MAG: hypothetical protein LiPW41_41 [Parcubacteria group bacterium LiPW_41]